MKRSTKRFVAVVLVGFLLPFTPYSANAETPGSCGGTANAPVAHCFVYGPNARVVDQCRCSGSSPATCGPVGSYYCENQLGTRIKNSGGTACVDACMWVTAPEPEALVATADPIVSDE